MNPTYNQLRNVADIAAQCVPDLSDNVSSAYEEYMAGKIARGAYEYVLQRQAQLIHALTQAGYTEKHPLFGYPLHP
jgi:hypothetical protein